MKAKDRREVLALIQREHESHLSHKKKAWYERLALSLTAAGLLYALALYFGLPMAAKGLEFLGGAIAHFLFFGTYE